MFKEDDAKYDCVKIQPILFNLETANCGLKSTIQSRYTVELGYLCSWGNIVHPKWQSLSSWNPNKNI